jgi:target of rapamycin complex 2 subunit MAPKAP1
MALLQNEDFAIWYLRTSYLASNKDGVGERLINVNNAILNTPGFRAAGWSTDPVHRTYSPPIPTTGAAEYFQRAPGLNRELTLDDDDDEGGMVTGRASNDTIGPALRRRRRKEPLDDDDSSDLSDESDDEGAQRAAQQIKFAKMPARHRADSSPGRPAPDAPQPEVTVSSPAKTVDSRRRTGSLGAVEAVKARARADTTTSSDMSSENELDPTYFQRRQINARSVPKSVPTDQRPGPGTAPLAAAAHFDSDEDSIGGSVGSSDLGETVDSTSALAEGTASPSSSPVLAGLSSLDSTGRSLQSGHSSSPKKTRTLPVLQQLPASRPISFVPPVSALSLALNAQKKSPKNPIQGFANLSGKGTPDPLWIKIYAPFSSDPEEPFEMPMVKTSKDGLPIIVAEAIGLALWRYSEEELNPSLQPAQLNVNKWCFRMVEDGEVEYDFPALARTRPITDFTSNNNRGNRGRSRGRSYDEFALVEVSDADLRANNAETPQFVPATEEPSPQITVQPEAGLSPHPGANRAASSRTNVLLAGQPFASALSDKSLTPADQPARAAQSATPRVGQSKTLRIRHFDVDMAARSTTIEISSDTYLAEILDQVCKKWNFDKGFYLLKVLGTNTVAPLDRTVEALGPRSDLELVRKRFGAGPAAMTGSPGSASPNAPLLLDIQGPKKGKKGQTALAREMAQKQDLASSASNFKKYYVTRKQLTSFAQAAQRVLMFDGDVLHILPGDAVKSSYAKTSSIPFSSIVRCKISSKHSKLVRISVPRPNDPKGELKRYDFEARTAGEAQEIVDDISREMRRARG